MTRQMESKYIMYHTGVKAGMIYTKCYIQNRIITDIIHINKNVTDSVTM